MRYHLKRLKQGSSESRESDLMKERPARPEKGGAMNFLLVHPITLESLSPEEAQVLHQLCARGEPPPVNLPQDVCRSLVSKDLLTGEDTSAWHPTLLGTMVFRRSHPIGSVPDWPDFRRFMEGGQSRLPHPSEPDLDSQDGAAPAPEGIPGADGVPGSMGGAHGSGRERGLDARAEWLRIQKTRRANLLRLVDEVNGSKLDTMIVLSQILGIARESLREALDSRGLSDSDASELEWAMNRRKGWMDADHTGEPE
jgi:hypothetical protein